MIISNKTMRYIIHHPCSGRVKMQNMLTDLKGGTMTVKEYLSQYRRLNTEIDSLAAECERLRSLAEKTGGSIIDGTLGKKTRDDNGASFERIAEQMIELEKEIQMKINTLLSIRSNINKAIDSVPDETLRSLLRYRYICGYTFERIAVEMNYSYKQICRKHGNALSLIKCP